MLATAANAQTVFYQDDTFQYYECNQIVQDVPEQALDAFYSTILWGVELYNKHTTGVQMVEPDRNSCFLSWGKENTMAMGWRQFFFFTSYEHFACFVNGSCAGNLEGYVANVSIGNGYQIFFVNTGTNDDALTICMRGGELEYGACN